LTGLISTTRNKVTVDVTPDTRILLFTLFAGVTTGVLFGLVPALRASRVSPNAAMKAQGRGVSDGHRRMRLTKTLVVVQVALSMVLVAGRIDAAKPSAISPRSILDSVRKGCSCKANLHGDRAAQDRLTADILARMRSIPGVRSAAASHVTPVGRLRWNTRIQVVGQAERKVFSSAILFLNATTDGYLNTRYSTCLRPRFRSRDNATSAPVAIINEAAAHKSSACESH